MVISVQQNKEEKREREKTASFERLTLSNTVRERGCSHLSPSVQLHKHAPNAVGTNEIVAMMMNGGW